MVSFDSQPFSSCATASALNTADCLSGYLAISRSIFFRDSALDRKSTRLNSSHSQISYAVFCLKKKKKHRHRHGVGRMYVEPAADVRPLLCRQSARCRTTFDSVGMSMRARPLAVGPASYDIDDQ